MNSLCYVPELECKRVRSLDLDPFDRARLIATTARLNALYMIARAGSGHIGSSFSAMDMVAWLFGEEMFGKDGRLYFSSKGHDAPGLYSVLIALGLVEFDFLHRLRRLNGLPGHPDICTPHIVTNTGSLGMGVSKAKGFAKAAMLTGRSLEEIVVMLGDGELQEGQVWESLQSAANEQLSSVTAIVDHNKIQSDTWVQNVSDLGRIEEKFASFGWRVFRCNGNDVSDFSSALAQARQVCGRPKVIIADTIKGCGVSFMESTAMKADEIWYRYHSGAPKPEDYARAIEELVANLDAKLRDAGQRQIELEWVETADDITRSVGIENKSVQRLVSAYSRALVREAARDSRIVALDADLVLDTGLIPFQDRFPDRFVECGIAEQDAVSQAGALALSGALPAVHSFACFLSTRANEQIYNNATEKTKIVYVGALAGLLPGGPGHSHQSVRDISVLGAIPGLVLIEPSTEYETELAVDYCYRQCPNSTYLRLCSVPWSTPFELPDDYVLSEGQGVLVREGDDGVVFSYGPVMLTELFYAAERLAAKGINLRLVNLPWLNRIDDIWLADTVKDFKWIFTVDDHYMRGGQGEMILSRLFELGCAGGARAMKFGISEIPVCGTNNEVLKHHGLDAVTLANEISDFMNSSYTGAFQSD